MGLCSVPSAGTFAVPDGAVHLKSTAVSKTHHRACRWWPRGVKIPSGRCGMPPSLLMSPLSKGETGLGMLSAVTLHPRLSVGSSCDSHARWIKTKNIPRLIIAATAPSNLETCRTIIPPLEFPLGNPMASGLLGPGGVGTPPSLLMSPLSKGETGLGSSAQ